MASGTIKITHTPFGEDAIDIPPLGDDPAGVFVLETKDLEFGSVAAEKYIDGVRLDFGDFSTLGTTRIQVGYRDDPSEDITWLGPYTIDQPVWIDPMTAKLWRLRITSIGGGRRWDLSEIEFLGDVIGGDRW